MHFAKRTERCFVRRKRFGRRGDLEKNWREGTVGVDGVKAESILRKQRVKIRSEYLMKK